MGNHENYPLTPREPKWPSSAEKRTAGRSAMDTAPDRSSSTATSSRSASPTPSSSPRSSSDPPSNGNGRRRHLEQRFQDPDRRTPGLPVGSCQPLYGIGSRTPSTGVALRHLRDRAAHEPTTGTMRRVARIRGGAPLRPLVPV